jgi:predicted methyltransferase
MIAARFLTASMLVAWPMASRGAPPQEIAAPNDPPRDENAAPFLLPGPCPYYQRIFHGVSGLCNAAKLAVFSGVKPGLRVAVIALDYVNRDNVGFFADELSRIVGPTGQVYALIPAELAASPGRMAVNGRLVTGDYADKNVKRRVVDLRTFRALPSFSAIFALNSQKSLFEFIQPLGEISFAPFLDALKPGGVLVVEDDDVEVTCAGAHCAKLAHPRSLSGLPRGEVAKMITNAGFQMEIETDHFSDPNEPQFEFVGRWGAMNGVFFFGYPFIWKFQKPTN